MTTDNNAIVPAPQAGLAVAEGGKQDAPSLAQGVYDNIQADEYHRILGLTKSGLMMLRKSPAHFWHWMTSPAEESTKAMNIGTATHLAVFEPHKFAEEIVVVPEDAPKKPTKAQMEAKKPSEDAKEAIAWWKEFYAKHEGKIVLTQEENADVQGMATSVRSNKEIEPYLTHPSAKPEVSIVSVEKVNGLDIVCKGRADLITMNNTAIVDLKTTEDASADGFNKSFMSYGYWMQAAHYIAICRKAGIPIERFIFIAAEKSPPYCTALYELSADSLEKAFAIRQRLMENLSTCIAKNDFPVHAKGVNSLTLPPWIN
jgi:exodeoxyribonuclease VIII